MTDGGRSCQRGFTLVEVLVAVVVFAIGVVGLVALTGRSVESSAAARQLRDAERLAQALMADLHARGFTELLEDGAGAPSVHDRGGPPVDALGGEPRVGEELDVLVAHRHVEPIADPEDPTRVDALRLEVLVLWVDHTDPAAPPPAALRVDALTPAMVDPVSPSFSAWVGHVRLSSVRPNDAGLSAGTGA